MKSNKQQKMVDAWTHPIGTLVDVQTDSKGVVRTKTSSAATLLGGHSAVIWLEDISGCYSLERVTPVK